MSSVATPNLLPENKVWDEAWGAGADLWVFSREKSSENSKALARLDWLLNFQVSNASLHRRPNLPEKIQEILKKAALKSLDFVEDRKNHLLISSQNFVPAQWVLLLDDAGDGPRLASSAEDWTLEIYKNWLSLGKHRLRVFLPLGLGASQFQKAWSKICKEACELSLIETQALKDVEVS
jgi:hypothetical protein